LRLRGSGSTGSFDQMIVPIEGEGFTPRITYHCDARALSFQVGLPEPVGPITYDLRRVNGDGLDAALRSHAEYFSPGD
jgi:hypothetical protein